MGASAAAPAPPPPWPASGGAGSRPLFVAARELSRGRLAPWHRAEHTQSGGQAHPGPGHAHPQLLMLQDEAALLLLLLLLFARKGKPKMLLLVGPTTGED